MWRSSHRINRVVLRLCSSTSRSTGNGSKKAVDGSSSSQGGQAGGPRPQKAGSVTWVSLGVAALTGAGIIAYYQVLFACT